MIRPHKPWRTIEQVELATAEWVDCNHRRIYQYCGDGPPVDLEAAYYTQRSQTGDLSIMKPAPCWKCLRTVADGARQMARGRVPYCPSSFCF